MSVPPKPDWLVLSSAQLVSVYGNEVGLKQLQTVEKYSQEQVATCRLCLEVHYRIC